MELQGANPDAPATLSDELPGKVHHLIGRERSRWRTDVATYAKVEFSNVYPGIDLVYYGNRGHLEYDFVVAPGFDPSMIRLCFNGADAAGLDDRGGLRFQLGGREIRLEVPTIYQEIDGVRREVRGGYAYRADGSIGFVLSSYDASRALVIDPVVQFSSFLGGSAEESPFGDVIGVDTFLGPDGALYVAGFTSSFDFPTSSALQPAKSGGFDAFVAKLDPTGSTLEFSTYFGGSEIDAARAIAVTPDGYITITGYTNSADFPTTAGVVQPGHGGQVDAYAVRFDPTGSSVVFATYLGGASFDVAFDVAVDGVGNSYLAGRTFSNDFPLVNALQPVKVVQSDVDAFIAKLNPTGTVLEYSTYLGGIGDDAIFGLDVDAGGNAFLVGRTYSPDFPATAGAIDESCGSDGACDGSSDAFVAKVIADGSALSYSGFLGGSLDDWGFAIDVDASGNAYVTGYTTSDDFPVSAHAVQPSFAGQSDAFVAKIDAAGAGIVFATYFGGSSLENLHIGREFLSFQGLGGIAVDPDGYVAVTGLAYSANLPVVNAIQPSPGGGSDAFVVVFDPIGSSIAYASYLGGAADDGGTAIHVGEGGNLHVAGITASSDFPLQDPLQPIYGGGAFDGFVTAFSKPLSIRVRSTADRIAPGDDLPVTLRLSNRTSNPEPAVLAVFLEIPGLGSSTILGPVPVGLPPEHTVDLEPLITIPSGAPRGIWRLWGLIGQPDSSGLVIVDVSGRGFIVE